MMHLKWFVFKNSQNGSVNRIKEQKCCLKCSQQFFCMRLLKLNQEAQYYFLPTSHVKCSEEREGLPSAVFRGC